MGGFSSISGSETIMFADNASFDGTKRGGAMTTNGQLWVGATASPHVKLGGITSPDGSVTIGYSSPNITLACSGNTVIPILQARISAETSPITGDGTNAVIVYNATQTNSNSMYNTTTGVLTFPQNGFYFLSASASLNNMLVANNVGFMSFAGPGYNNRFFRGNFGAMADYVDTGRLAINGSWLAHFSAGQTLSVTLYVAGNASKNITVEGDASADVWTNFDVFYITNSATP